MKILAVVEFNDREAFVLDEEPKLNFTRHNTRTIVGTDGTFCDCYAYERPTRYAKAFAGRKFTLKLTDGTEEKCDGQWWSSVTAKAREVLGDVIYVTACDIASLRDCYVFTGYTGVKPEIEKLRSRYDGPVYGYREFEKMLDDGWGAARLETKDHGEVT